MNDYVEKGPRGLQEGSTCTAAGIGTRSRSGAGSGAGAAPPAGGGAATGGRPFFSRRMSVFGSRGSRVSPPFPPPNRRGFLRQQSAHVNTLSATKTSQSATSSVTGNRKAQEERIMIISVRSCS